MIIALTGEMGAGKTTLAQQFVEAHHYNRMSFARRFKVSLAALFGWEVFKMDDSEYKNGIDPITGSKRRDIMRQFATEFVRDMIDPEFHTKVTAKDIFDSFSMDKNPVIIDDLRHWDEKRFIRDVNGITIRVTRRNNPYEQDKSHRSEQYYVMADYEVENVEGNPKAMYDSVMALGIVPVYSTKMDFLCEVKLDQDLVRQYIKSWIVTPL